ncbi:alpha/beta hydrolase [Mumia zhuanghuii]|uniref:Alpha/beta fold hydrolase n=2 Tax=Mumia TaxID=1546255 RepID=A0ABW1QRY1_9ACTN|nr:MULTISPECIES: alpha/beta fold hydrolase [Mumia]KAA1420508.1 alpha/beta hydrolase [Mumia zhuanghuii]
MTVFLLVHGAFRGGWSWRRVRPYLIDAGHDVYAPSLSGAGERAAVPVAGLSTWVDDVVGLIETEDLHDVVLVGHSQGSLVARAVADAVPHRIRHLVHVDGAVPDVGERAVDLTPGAAGLPPRDTLIPSRAPVVGGDLDAETVAWMAPRLTPTPFAPSLDPRPGPAAEVPETYVFCARTPAGYPSETTRARLDERGTPYALIDAGHDAPLTAPALVAASLMQI